MQLITSFKNVIKCLFYNLSIVKYAANSYQAQITVIKTDYTEDTICDEIFCKCKLHNSINEIQGGSSVMRRQESIIYVQLLFCLKVNSIFQIYYQENLDYCY